MMVSFDISREIRLWIVDEVGNEARNFDMLQDISQQLKHEHELEYRERLAQQTERITREGPFIFDELAERYIHISPGFEKILGMSGEQYMHKVNSSGSFMDDVYELDRPLVEAGYKQLLIDY
jgi:hypothetical protein